MGHWQPSAYVRCLQHQQFYLCVVFFVYLNRRTSFWRLKPSSKIVLFTLLSDPTLLHSENSRDPWLWIARSSVTGSNSPAAEAGLKHVADYWLKQTSLLNTQLWHVRCDAYHRFKDEWSVVLVMTYWSGSEPHMAWTNEAQHVNCFRGIIHTGLVIQRRWHAG